MDNAILENLGGDLGNGGADAIQAGLPVRIGVTIQGTSDMLFHRWQSDEVEAKGKAKKGSDAKKTDNVAAYVWRNEKGEMCLPTEYLRQSIIHAAKFRQDPRSPRKSAMDLYKAGVLSLSNLTSFGVSKWDYLDRRRVVIQRNGVTRTRPAMLSGWKTTHEFLINVPEYISVNDLRETIEMAGRLVGVGDFRPSFGRFGITNYEVLG
jgi:hypothetical protein